MTEPVKEHRRARVAWAAALLLAACAGARPAGEVVVTQRESPNYTVYVIEDEDGVRRLRFERHGVDQSAVVLGDPDELVFSYMRGLMAAFAARPHPSSVLVVGLGGGTLPMFLRHHLPATRIDIVEIDPVVVDVARKDLGFKDDPAMLVHVADGRAYIEHAGETWDVIVLDAFGAEEIPMHLATRQFYEAVRAHLAPGGLVAANIWGERQNKRYRSMLRTFEAVFPEVHVVAPRNSDSRIVLAFGAPEQLTTEDLAARAAALQAAWRLRFDLPQLVKKGHVMPEDLIEGGGVIEDEKPDAPN